VKVIFGIALVLFLIGLARFPAKLQGAVAFERGRRAEHSGLYSQAAAQYEAARSAFPNSTTPVARLAVVYYRMGSYERSTALLMGLHDREMPAETINELNRIIDELERIYR
jgi:hypothetical protein